MAIVRKTLTEILAHPVSDERLKEIENIKDEDIDYSEIAELTETDFSRAIPYDEFLAKRKDVMKTAMTITIEQQVLQQFQEKAKQSGEDYQYLINQALKEYLLAHS